MYLSQLILNPRSRQVQRELADPYQRHRTILHAFPKTLPLGERVLHRLETPEGGLMITLLVQSQSEPDWSWLHEKNYLLPPDPGVTQPNPAVKTFELRLQPDQVLRFRLCANPSVKKKREGKKHSNRVPLMRPGRQLEWLERKSQANGFRPFEVRISQVGQHWGEIRRGPQEKHRLTMHSVQFDGLLSVTDAHALEAAVREGVGPAKAFGCGLLSLAPSR